MSRGRILYIGGFEMPDKNAAAQRVVGNAKVFRELGYEVIFVGIAKNINNNSSLLSTKAEFEGFEYYTICYPTSIIDWFRYITSIDYLKVFQNLTFTHIIAYNFPGVALYRLLRLCKKKRIALIGDCSEWYEPSGNIIFKIIKSFDVFLRMKILQPKLDGLIVISDFLYKYYNNLSRNIINIPPLVDLNMAKWVENYKITRSPEVMLVYAGSPGGKKKDRLDLVISLLSKIKDKLSRDFKLFVIGLTKEEYIKMFSESILPDNHESFLIFKGRISHTNTIHELSKASYQVFLRDENLINNAGFPTKFVESISAGTPVLTNSSSNISRFLIESENGFLLDLRNEEILESQLIHAINLSMEEILYMKKSCKESKTFHYLNYKEIFEEFLNNARNY